MVGNNLEADTTELTGLKQRLIQIGTTTTNVAANVRTARRDATPACQGYASAQKALSRLEEAWVIEAGLHSTHALDLAAAIRDFTAALEYLSSTGAAAFDQFYVP